MGYLLSFLGKTDPEVVGGHSTAYALNRVWAWGNSVVTALAEDAEGGMWIGVAEGTYTAACQTRASSATPQPDCLSPRLLIFSQTERDAFGWGGKTTSTDRLSGIRSLPDVGPGPESVAIGRDGRLYTGLQDGRVVRMLASGSGVETFVQTGGRPLGMKFDARGNLIVADAFRGLLSVSPERRVTVLADTVNGERMLFPNDIAIAADGTVWFSRSSLGGQRKGQQNREVDRAQKAMVCPTRE